MVNTPMPANERWDLHRTDDDDIEIHASNGYCVATVHSGSEADARAIAAAPAMLAALETMVAWDEGDPVSFSEAMNAVRAAIAQAKGEG